MYKMTTYTHNTTGGPTRGPVMYKSC